MKEIWNRFNSARFLTIVSTALLFLVIGNNTIADDHADESTTPHVWSANMMMASEYVFRGITQSNEDPAIQVGIDYTHEPSGFYIGTWASSVEFNTGNADGTQIETNLYGGFAGSFFATRQAFISPESFTFIESAIIVAIVVLGGMGSQTGVVLASIFLIGITEMFRDLEQYRMIAFGGAMVLIMVFKPKGILANRKPTILMHGDKK